MKKSVTRSFRLSEGQLKLLQQKADGLGISLNELVSMVINNFLMGGVNVTKSGNTKVA